MKICKPVLDQDFSCLMSRCPDTCCAGWLLPVDEMSRNGWQQLPSPWHEEMDRATQDIEGEYYLRQVNGRCAMLDEQNLCRLYAACGEESLCQTCHLHPRFVMEFGGVREVMPGLSCPEWAHLWLMNDGRAAFAVEETDELPALNDIDGAWYYHLKSVRRKMIDMAQNRELSMPQRMEQILKMAQLADEDEEETTILPDVLPTYRRKLQRMEILTPHWRELLQTQEQPAEQPWRDTVAEQLLVYYLFRFYLKGVFDGRSLPWAKLAVWSTVMIYHIGAACTTREEFCEIARLYAKEMEHNAQNIESLHRALCRRSGRYSVSGILQAVKEGNI